MTTPPEDGPPGVRLVLPTGGTVALHVERGPVEDGMVVWLVYGPTGGGCPAGSHFAVDFPPDRSTVRILLEGAANGRAVFRSPSPHERRAAATGGGPCPTCGKPFYTHVCLTCSPDAQTPGPGCHNCRNTSMDQTPCKPPSEAP